jgi:hypothetical protein
VLKTFKSNLQNKSGGQAARKMSAITARVLHSCIGEFLLELNKTGKCNRALLARQATQPSPPPPDPRSEIIAEDNRN